MGKHYAGILGIIAFLLALLRGILAGSRVETTLVVACACMFIFSLIGLIVGNIAYSTVNGSMEKVFEKELAALGGSRGSSDTVDNTDDTSEVEESMV
ncbi:MAG: hypothetical protein MPJ24_09645 [Pirellulaceae bacterium]|nr:hypothetical protein [Pirellulaceae bacterium]